MTLERRSRRQQPTLPREIRHGLQHALGVVAVDRRKDHAHQPHVVFRTLSVASGPEQVFSGAARPGPMLAGRIGGLSYRGGGRQCWNTIPYHKPISYTT